jgi:hypothetical protein
MRRIKLVLTVASMVVLLVAFAAPAMADDFHHNHFFNNHDHFFNNHDHFFNDFNNNGVFQRNEQDVESGDSSQSFNVTGGGDNSNTCQGIQGISNTGNVVNSTGVLQANNPFDNGFNNGFFDGFNHNDFNNDFNNRFFDGFNNGFNNDGVEVSDSGNFEISPSSTTSCTNAVNQAASASG